MVVDPIFSSYTELYSDFTTLKFPPEVYYFAAISSYDFPAEVTIFDTYQGFNNTGLFHNKVLQDILLDVYNPDWSNVFTAPNSQYYVRYTGLNFGLGGFFTEMTPRQVIEGYTDPILAKFQALPIYAFGDMTLNTWISADN